MTRAKLILAVWIALMFVFLLVLRLQAASCPPPDVTTICVSWEQPTGEPMKEAVILLKKNGVDLPPLTIPATGGSSTVFVPTVPCEKAVYTGMGYNVTADGRQSAPVAVLPVAGIVKDRTAECSPAPRGLTIVSQTPDSITIECALTDCPNGLTTTTTGSTKTKAVRTVKKHP